MFYSKERSGFRVVLALVILLAAAMPLTVQGEAMDQSFLFCFDGDAKAGQQGNYPVIILEDMVQKDKTVFVDGAARIVVQGSNNPKADGSNAKGIVPTTGAAMAVIAPAEGTITVYGINGTNSSDGSGKTFWVVPEGGEAWSLSDPGEIKVSQDVKAGDKVWFYAAGSKFQYGAVHFQDAAFRPEEPVAAQDDRAWQFIRFGTSTSDAANRVAEGADIKESVTLYACTVAEDGTVLKKGGKFVADAPADGESFYYTTINPQKENFKLMADVHVDYMNPTPDGQEGFALMLRDTISGTGSYYSNTVSVASSKLRVLGKDTKSVLGTRNYSGIVSNENADLNQVIDTRIAFTEDVNDLVKQGGIYRICLEKTAYGYITSQYAINEDGSTGDLLGSYIQYIPAKDPAAQSVSSYSELDDPMCIQEKDKAYLALVCARGMHVTFSNISFTTSPWKAADWQPQPTTYVKGSYLIKSPNTAAEDTYELVFKSNADGTASIWRDKELVEENIPITANTELHRVYPIFDNTIFNVDFTPDPDFAFSAFEKLESYEMKTVHQLVKLRRIGTEDTIYVTPKGKTRNDGTSWEKAVDIKTALEYATAGQTILLEASTYKLKGVELKIDRGRNGTVDAPITLTAHEGIAIFDFCGTGKGLSAWGDWWRFSNINICNTAPYHLGMELAGNHNIVERMNFYNNGSTGMQISGTSHETIEQWPSYNTVINCTAMNNGDPGYEDADGFAAKLTCGPGNIFIGCISAYNADDGWDLFAKAASGPIGMVTIEDSVAYRNGYLMVKEGSAKSKILFADIQCDELGNLFFVGEENADYFRVDAGNGNGFKLGGTNIPGNHLLANSIAYENKSKGVDANSCPDVRVFNTTSFNNGSYNVAFYTNNQSAKTAYEAKGLLSFRTDGGISDQLKLQDQSSRDVCGEYNFYWDQKSGESRNGIASVSRASADWFESLDTGPIPGRKEDGTIDMHGLLMLNKGARIHETGAQGAAWGQEEPEKALIWAVGDSTVSAFNDSYYIPRQGWGEQLGRYFHADVYNLARSGASSKDFTGMKEYDMLMNGDEGIPALGSGEGEKFLLIGFGHNDQKTEAARFTDPNGDYRTPGSFANSLYENYVKPALERGVTPVLVTPIARLTDENTAESYQSASGHVTEDEKIGDTLYPGGDYAMAILEMCASLNLPCIDLTEATIQMNVELGNEAQYLHAFNGAKLAEDGISLIPAALDKTHTNVYGAKMHAWLIARGAENTGLGKYVKAGKNQPSYEADFADSINPDYVLLPYKAPEAPSAYWPVYTDSQGREWYGTAFGDIGGDKAHGGNFTAKVDEAGLTLSVAENTGKISSATDGLLFYYTALPAGTSFTLTATATVNELFANNQVSFGLMARDELYLDTYVKETMGDYVAAGSRNQGAYNCFGRKDGALLNGPAAEKVYGAGDRVALKITGTVDGFTMQYGENPPVSAGFDYALTAIDTDSIYVGFYAVRNASVTFSDIQLIIEE
ncbi:MAG: right-handed parallel beta-helix repeat-containing protein [Clostridia bacterium]|nr:right-handed parallel beta-helix repeat-containing protein [Clostridia bacterium]